MPLFLHMADVHLGHRQYNLLEREKDMNRTFRTTLNQAVDDNQAVDEDVAFVVHAGDLFHNKDVDARILSDAEDGLNLLTDADIPFVTIQGNHDAKLYAQSLTWLEYLHRRGHLILLEAEFEDETATFGRHDPTDPGWASGFVDIDGTRVFGLQYRGHRVRDDLPKVADGIRRVNESEGQLETTVLLAHLGVEGHVPGLGASVDYNDLTVLEDEVDYLGLGHIHKAFEHNDWVYNPGSPEVHSTRELEWDHGYYLVEGTGNNLEATHVPSKRRPFHSVPFSVDDYGTPSELESGFEQAMRAEVPSIETKQEESRFRAQGDPRTPVIDLRIDGLLQFDRQHLDVDGLTDIAEAVTDAVYVQPAVGVRTVAIKELLAHIDDEEDLWEGDRLDTDRLEGLVFERIAENSAYDAEAEAVAGLMSSVKDTWSADEGAEVIADLIQEQRRELFPDRTTEEEADS